MNATQPSARDRARGDRKRLGARGGTNLAAFATVHRKPYDGALTHRSKLIAVDGECKDLVPPMQTLGHDHLHLTSGATAEHPGPPVAFEKFEVEDPILDAVPIEVNVVPGEPPLTVDLFADR